MSGNAPVVLHVLEALEGGTARHVTDVVNHATGVRHVVAIPSTRSGYVTDEQARPAMEAAGARVVTIEMRRFPLSWSNAVALGRLHRLIAEVDPDIVHGHSSVGGALGRLAAGRRPRRVYTPNGFSPSPSQRRAERVLDRLSDVVVAVSPSEAADLAADGLARHGRMVTIPNGIELEPPQEESPDLRAMLELDPGTPLVGTIARLVPQKAPERFVEVGASCLRRRPDAHLVLIGSGRLQTLLEHKVDELGVRGQFHQIAALPGASRVLGQLDVFVLASRFEGGAYTPLEAMRAGVPVILSDVVGNRDVVEPGVSGLVMDAEDTAAMGDAVSALLDDPARAAALAAAARARLADRFDVRTMGASLSQLYLEEAAER